VNALLDSSALVALVVQDHVHHDAARRWVLGSDSPIATCPITQGALIRALFRSGVTGGEARRVLVQVCTAPRHVFWPDDPDYQDVALDRLLGHRQVTDAYLAELTRRRGGRLVTLDKGLADQHADVALLLETGSG
jgi:toxin-antitoxin system PIN domain toxin